LNLSLALVYTGWCREVDVMARTCDLAFVEESLGDGGVHLHFSGDVDEWDALYH